MGVPCEVTLLVVDDNAQNLMTVEAILKPEGYNIITLNQASEALKYLLVHEVTLVILDVNMPHINGFELAKILREREKTRNVPIIFTSGFHVDEHDAHLGYELGAIDYLTLPLNPHILKAKVAALASFYEKERELVRRTQELRELEKKQYEMNERASAANIQEKTSALERSNEELKRFGTVVAHDLQEPLRTLSLRLGLLRDGLGEGLDEEAKEHIACAMDASKRMSTLIRDLLKYSQVEGRSAQNRSLNDFNIIVEKAIQNVQGAIKESEARLSIESLPSVVCNEAQMIQVIQNLISNAIKFRGQEAPEIKIYSRELERDWLISIGDNGIGIPSDKIEKLFKVFQRLHNVEKYPGTGIGLAICKKIIEAHEGRIWVESNPSNGSVFHLSLPKGTRTPIEAISPRVNTLNGMKVLIVDDDPSVLASIEQCYRAEGIVFDKTLNGEVAVNLARKKSYDAIVMDIQMPLFDGFETMELIQKNAITIPVIAFTGLDLEIYWQKLQKAGFLEIVSKDFGPEKLRAPFERCFNSVMNIHCSSAILVV